MNVHIKNVAISKLSLNRKLSSTNTVMQGRTSPSHPLQDSGVKAL
jgi:hypothetical protein